MLRLCLVALCLAVAAPCRAQAPDEKWQTDRALVVSPAAAPTPALRYRLFPSSADRKEGNAVPIYLRLTGYRNDDDWKRQADLPVKWNALPLAGVPLVEARQYLAERKYDLRQLELGARRKTADWEYPLDQGREAGGIFGIRMGDAQLMRSLSRLLVLQARVQIADGDLDGAVRTLETGFAFAQQVADGGFLVNDLIAVASAYMLVDVIPDLQERPKAPNLYWAIATLPRPFFDGRRAAEMEALTIKLQFPELFDLDRSRTEAEWNTLLVQFRRVARQSLEGGPAENAKLPLPEEPADKSTDLADARRFLAERAGLPQATVEKMPAAQALLRYIGARYKEHNDEMLKCFYLAAPEAVALAENAEVVLKNQPDSESTLLLKLTVPAFSKVLKANVRVDRKIAALRTVEALRMHAAANEGQLPDRLSDVTVAPVPDDPGTGKPFDYVKDGATATLSGKLPGQPLATSGLRYRVTLRK